MVDAKGATVERHDAAFIFSIDTLADAYKRGFSFVADNALLAICRETEESGGRVMAADPWRSAPVAMLRAVMSRGRELPMLEGVDVVKPLRLRRHDPSNLRALRRSYQRYDDVLRQYVEKSGLNRPAVLTFNPFVAAFSPMRWASTITYYAQDDWAAFPPVSRLWSAYREAYRALRERGVRIVCVSTELSRRVAVDARSVILPNAVDEVLWSSQKPPPAAMLRLPSPIVTYVGTIDERLDAGLIERVAKDRAVGSVALIGSVPESSVARRLEAIPKVTLCGPMGRPDVAGALMYSDTCIIPHVIDHLTISMSPLKLYEYLAAGKPVVSTDLLGVRGVSERVVISSAGDFPEAVRAALELSSLSEGERLEFIRENSWESRHDRLLRIMWSADSDWWKM